MFVNKFLDQMLDETEALGIAYEETWRPIDQSLRHPKINDIWFGEVYGTSRLYTGQVMSNVTQDGIYLETMDLALHLAIENAIHRAHSKDLTLPISIILYAGVTGSVLRIKDSGPGFPYEEYIQKHSAGDTSYKSGNGTGFNCFSGPDIEVSFENSGSSVNIMGMFDLKRRG